MDGQRYAGNDTSENHLTLVSFTDPLVILIATVLGALILITIVGNSFVIAAIFIERNLQSVANYLIVSLAVADLMVACLVMPLGAVYEINSSWSLSPKLCDMWTSSDVLCCTASILHLVAIAVDRYWAVTNLNYIQARNSTRIGILICAVWVVSLGISLAPQFGWKDPNYLERIAEGTCLISQDPSYQIFATFATFYLPLLVILFLYWKIFQAARKRIRKRPGTIVQPARQKKKFFRFVSKRPREETTAFTLPPEHSSVSLEKSLSHNGEKATPSTTSIVATTTTTISGTSTLTTTTSVSTQGATIPGRDGTSSSSTRRTRETIESKRERKAAKTLAIITGAFVACWLPFFSFALLRACLDYEPPPTVASVFLWLGYFNSTLNPVIYTIFSPEFRQAFKRILCGGARIPR